jgi:hypothetical protein
LLPDDLLAFLNEGPGDDGQDTVGHGFVKVQSVVELRRIVLIPAKQAAPAEVPRDQEPADDLLRRHATQHSRLRHTFCIALGLFIAARVRAADAGAAGDRRIGLDLLIREPGQKVFGRHLLDPLLSEGVPLTFEIIRKIPGDIFGSQIVRHFLLLGRSDSDIPSFAGLLSAPGCLTGASRPQARPRILLPFS